MKPGWIYPFIILGGAVLTWGAAMNAQLLSALENRWLASAVSFAVITAFFVCLFVMFPSPFPGAANVAGMPWWAPLAGSSARSRFMQVSRSSTRLARAFVGFTVTATLITSLVLDHFGWFGVPVREITLGRIVGALLLVGGIALIAKS